MPCGGFGCVFTNTSVPSAIAKYHATEMAREIVTDAGNFQSVLFSFDREEPSFFPGLALAVGDEARELVPAGAGQDGQRQLGADAADFQQPPEQRAFVLAGKTVQGVGVVLDRKMGQQHQRLAVFGQLVEHRHRRLDLVTDAVDVDQQEGRMF